MRPEDVHSLIGFINDERGVADDVFKLAAAIILVAAVFGILMGLISIFMKVQNPVEEAGNISIKEVQSNAEKIGTNESVH